MANNSTIDKMLADPKFRQLMTQSPDRAKALVLEARQKDFGKIPKTEGFLQKSIRTAGLFVPQSKEEWSDVPQIAGQAIGLPLLKLSPPMQAISAFTPSVNEGFDKLLEPKTEWGKEMNKFVGRAQIAVPASLGMKKLVEGGGKFVGRVMADPKEFAYNAGKAVETAREALLDAAQGKFGKAFEKINPTMVRSDWDDIILKSVDDLTDGSQQAAQQLASDPSSDVSKLYKLVEDIPNGVTLTKEFIQHKYKKAYQMLSSRAKAIFLKHASDNIKVTATGLDEAKKVIAPVYKIAKGKTPISETNLRMVASGKVPKSKVADLMNVEKEIGTSYVKEGKNIAGAKKTAKVATATATGLGGLAYLKSLFEK